MSRMRFRNALLVCRDRTGYFVQFSARSAWRILGGRSSDLGDVRSTKGTA